MADFYKDRFKIFTGSIIQSVGFISEQYVFQRTPVPEIIQRLKFSKTNLENLIKIFFIFENDPQSWNKLKIESYSFRATLGSQFFNYEDKSVSEILVFMMNLYKELYNEFATEEERENFSNIFLMSFMNQLSGSTRRISDLVNNFNTRTTDIALDKIWIISKMDRSLSNKTRFNQFVVRDKELVDSTQNEFPFALIPIEAIYHLRDIRGHVDNEELNYEALLFQQSLEDRDFEYQTINNRAQEYSRMTRARNRNITRSLYNLQRLMPTHRLNVADNLDTRLDEIRYVVRNRYIL
jgi:hypothetical protein